LNTFITFGVIFLALIVALILGPIAIWLADRLGLIDDPNSAPHKVHAQLVPLVGGIILLISIFTVNLIYGNLRSSPIPAILVPSLVIFGFGIWDDYKNISPLWKIAGQLIATAILIYMGVQVEIFHQNWLNLVITVLWMVGITNAYNFIDSMDGLAIGLASLASAFFMLITIESQQPQLSLFSMVMFGASVSVYYYNAPPARIFLGDSGAQLLGFLLGALAISYNPLGYTVASSWYVPILLMGVPIFDTTLVVLSRLRRGIPVYQAGLDHTYHRLVRLGLSSNRAVLTMHLAALMMGALAFIALKLSPLIGNSIFASVLLIAACCFILLDIQPKALA
jgi:UDP-GlcNAc:undecaprenyl-phosphate GlcNAc-1-phosphate transferase